MTLALGGISSMTLTQSKMNECEDKSPKNQSSYAMETGQQKLKCKSSTKNVKEGLEISHLPIESTTPLPEDSHMAEKKQT